MSELSLFRKNKALIVIGFSMSVVTAQAADGRNDYDVDDNGLIEINDLADLNEMRNDLAGTSLYSQNLGCPDAGCNGYELTADLDFDTNSDGVINENDEYWNGGSGWAPIGSSEAFTAIFNGNDHEIRNLYISRFQEDRVALFGYTSEADIRNVGIGGTLSSVTGDQDVGMLVGFAVNTDLIKTFATGAVAGSYSVGGLVGRMNYGRVLYSYATTRFVRSYGTAGGFIGGGHGHQIYDSYATGSGLSGTTTPSGLSVASLNVISLRSYWDTDVSGVTTSGAGTGFTTVELQCPTSTSDMNCATNPYADWEGEYWDFGTTSEYPALIFDGIPTRDSDSDGVWDFNDAFPDNVAASIDSDNDGLPDRWNAGCDTDCQNGANLTLDDDPLTPQNTGGSSDGGSNTDGENTADGADNDSSTDDTTTGNDASSESSSGSGGSAGVLLALLMPLLLWRRKLR